MPMDFYETLISQIKGLRRGGGGEYPKPHKMVMILTALDLAEDGLLQQNKIYFNATLIERFHRHFASVARGDDLSQPSPPFFHLRGSGFWFHKIKPGREGVYATLTTSGGGSKRILENIEYAYLSEEAFQVISDDIQRGELRRFLFDSLQHYGQSFNPNT